MLKGETYTTSGNCVRLFYLDNNKIKFIDTAGGRHILQGYNKYDGSITIAFIMGVHPIWSEKISNGKINAYNKLCDDVMLSPNKLGCSYSRKMTDRYGGKIISKKKFKQLRKKYYSNVCEIKMFTIQKNNTIKKSYNCITNKLCYKIK